MAKKSAAPSRQILEAALQGLEAQRQRLDEQISEVRAMLRGHGGRSSQGNGGGRQEAGNRAGTARKKRVLSPEARKRIAVAQKKRWAAFRKSQA